MFTGQVDHPRTQAAPAALGDSLTMLDETLTLPQEAPSRIRSLARFAQIITILGVAVIVWYCAEAAYLMVFASAEYDQMLTFTYSVLSSSPEFAPVFEAGQKKYPVPESYSPLARGIVYVTSNLINVLALFALYWARELFRGYGRGEIFAEVAAMRLGKVGWMVTLLAPIGFIADFSVLKTVVVAAAPMETGLSFSGADFALMAFISVSELDAFAIVIGLLIVLVGRILSEASKISDENRSFI